MFIHRVPYKVRPRFSRWFVVEKVDFRRWGPVVIIDFIQGTSPCGLDRRDRLQGGGAGGGRRGSLGTRRRGGWRLSILMER